MLQEENHFMQEALEEARKAFSQQELPIGAVIVHDKIIIGRGYNQTEQLHDVTAHAEILAITAASNYLKNKYLLNCTLYVTLEPCMMCMGAIHWSQIQSIIFGVKDNKDGFLKLGKEKLKTNMKIKQIQKPFIQRECTNLLKKFFRKMRK